MTTQEQLDWLTKTVLKIAAQCQVDIADAADGAEQADLALAADVIDIQYTQCMEVINNV